MLVCVLLFVFAARVAAQTEAQQVPAAERTAEAERAYAEGRAAFDAGQYATALERFREADRLLPHDANHFNIAVCLERLGRYRDALHEYATVRESASLSDAARTRAGDASERLAARVAVLVVDGEPAGGVVHVDGAERCIAPCELDVDVGPHVVALVTEGARATTDVVVERGERRVVHLRVVLPELEPPLMLLPPPRTEWRARGLSWLSVAGGALALVGVAGTLGFGVRAGELDAAWNAPGSTAPESTRIEGILMRDLTNASIAVLAVGAIGVSLDVVLGLTTGEQAVVEPTEETTP